MSASRFGFKLGPVYPGNTKTCRVCFGSRLPKSGECVFMLTCCFLYHVQLLFLFSKLFISARLLRHSHLSVFERFSDSFLRSIYREASSRPSSQYFRSNLVDTFYYFIAEAKMPQSLDLLGKSNFEINDSENFLLR